MARIPDSELDRLKAEVSLVQLIEGAGYTLSRQGKDWAMRCPFHAGDDTPSFIVTPSKNVWHCFGCQAGGSVVDWVMRREEVSFRHAVEVLREGGLPLAAGAPVKIATVRKLASPVARDADDQAALGQVIDYYHTTLKAAPEALAYLASRGLDHPELIDHFRLGFANRTLGLRLPEKTRVAGADIRTRLQRIGVYRANGREHFNGSLIIPVADASGAIAEVYGRKITPAHRLRAGTALHLYLPGPHRGVFNLDGWCGASVAPGILPSATLAHPCASEVILCEALIDALTFWCAGVRNVTSAFGVSGFTDELLAAFVAHGVKRVLIAYDADDAGDSAALKLAPVLESQGIATLRIVVPHGMDANSYVQKVGSPAHALRLLIEQAQCLGSGGAPVRSVPAVTVIDASDPPLVTPPPASQVPDDLPLVAALSPAPAQDAALSAPLTPALASSPALEVREDEAIAVFGERRYRVRGIKKNLSYDTLKVTLQVSAGAHLHMDTLDLYQAKARAAFVKQAGIELGIEERIVQTDLIALLRALEPVQDAAITRTLQPAAPELPALSSEEEAAALALLRDPALMDRIAADVEAIGVVGEGSNARVGYLACVSRKLDKPLAILIQSTSAAGKSTLMDALLSLMPETERVHYSAMTGQSLFYLGEQAMKHKILGIAEEEGVRQAAYALKLLQSQGELTIASTGKDPATGQLVTQEYRVEGPVMLFLTTTAIDIDEELLNRCLVLTINETREQTQAIHHQQRHARTLAGLLSTTQGEAIRRLHRAAQTLLRPLAVVNPYAEQLTFRSESTRLRRDHAKYLTLIDSIALLHQHQRPIHRIEHAVQGCTSAARAGSAGAAAGRTIEYVEVTREDLALANRLAHEVLGRSLDELPPQTRRVLGVLDALVRERMQSHALARAQVRFTRTDARHACALTDTALRVHLDRLIALEMVLVHRGGYGSRFEYELAFEGEVGGDAAQFDGLLDVATLRVTPQTLQGTEPSLQGSEPKLAPPLHPENTPLAAGLQGGETPRSASADAASSLVAAHVPETARLGTPRTKPSHANGRIVAAAH